MPLQRTLLYGLVAVLVLAPLPFGSVETWTSTALAAACLGLGALWTVWRARRGHPALPWKDPLLAAGALVALVGVAQLIPLPRPVLENISPRAVELRDRYEPRAFDERSEHVRPSDADAWVGARAVWRPVSLYPWATRQSVLRLAAFLVAALIAVDLATFGHGRRVIVAGLVAGGAFQALYGLAEYFSGRQHIFGYAKKYYTDVATGTFINRNHFAGYLEMTLPFAIALAGAAIARARRPAAGRPGPGGRSGAPGRALFGAVALLVLSLTMVTALLCSRSRMGIASALLSLSLVGAVLAWRGRGRSFVAAAVIVAGATTLVFSQGDAASAVVDRFLASVREMQGNVGRWQIWAQATGMAAAFPLAGSGLGTFPYIFPAFRTGGAGIGLAHAHNDYLELAAEVGAAGLALGLVAAALLARGVLRWRAHPRDESHLGYAALAGLAAIAFHSLADFNLAIPGNALTLAAVLGLALVSARTPFPVVAAPAEPARRPGVRAWLATGAMAAAALAVVVSAVTGDAGRTSRMAARTAAPALEDLLALVQARDEGGMEPSAEAGRYVERRLGDALSLQARALSEWPTSSRAHLQMGKLRIGHCAASALAAAEPEDCLPGALAELQAALALSPMSATTHADVARVLLAAWPVLDDASRADAAPIIERAQRMNPADRDLRGATLAMRAVEAAP
jgi:O-antigen ligase